VVRVTVGEFRGLKELSSVVEMAMKVKMKGIAASSAIGCPSHSDVHSQFPAEQGSVRPAS